MRAPVDCAGRSTSQYSQFGRSSSAMSVTVRRRPSPNLPRRAEPGGRAREAAPRTLQAPTRGEDEVATMPPIQHVAVTVSDLGASTTWYSKVLDAQPVLDEDTGPFHHVVFQLGGTLLGLHGFPALASTERFDEHRPGLD